MPVEYKILRDEDPIAFQYRVSKDKDLIGTWQDVADICNRELGSNIAKANTGKTLPLSQSCLMPIRISLLMLMIGCER